MPECASPETRSATLAYLREHADEAGEVVASLRDIGNAIGVGMNTASRAVKYWMRRGHVVVLRRGTGGQYRTRYRIELIDAFPSADESLADLSFAS